MPDTRLPLVRGLAGAPESTFAIGDIRRAADGALLATQTLGRAAQDATGRTQVAALGVLVDDVLGYAVIDVAPDWSVSTDLAIEVLDDLPTDGVLTCTARVVHQDGVGALVQGDVRDAEGRVLALCTLRGRFVPGSPPEPPAAPDLHLGSGRASAPREAVDSIDAALGLPDVGPSAGSPGAELLVPVTEAVVNPVNTVHGGMYLALLERASARAVPTPSRTASLRGQFVRSAPVGSTLRLVADVVHPGRTLAVVQTRLVDAATGKVCALATVVRH